MINLLCIILLVLPSVSLKLYRDRNGRRHPDPEGVAWVLTCWMLGFIAVALIQYPHESMPHVLLLKCLAVSFTGHGAIFNYAFNALWINKASHSGFDRQQWFEYRVHYVLNHLSDSAVPDRWQWWRSLGPYGRLAVYLVCFVISILWFVL